MCFKNVGDFPITYNRGPCSCAPEISFGSAAISIIFLPPGTRYHAPSRFWFNWAHGIEQEV
jgi:hypothetical protein